MNNLPGKLRDRMSLTTIVVSILLGTTTLFQVAVGAFFYQHQHSSQFRELENQMEQLSDQAARILEYPLWSVDTMQVIKIVDNFSLIPAVFRISVTDEKGKTIFNRILGDPNKIPATVKAPRRAISHGAMVLGFVEFEFSTEPVENRLRYYLGSILASIFIMICVQVMTLYLLLGKTIITPIKSIETYAAKVSSDASALPEPTQTIFTGELASLRRSIVTMVTALMNSQKEYRLIYENSLEGIFQTTLHGTFIKANPALTSMLGYSSSEELRAAITDIGKQLFVVSDKRQELIDIVTEHGCATRREIALRHKDGHTIHCLISIYAAHNEEGRIDHLEGSLIDISERKKAEEQLTLLNYQLETLVEQRTAQLNRRNALLIASEERYRNLVETIQEGLLTVERDGRLTFVNQQMSALLGLRPPDMIGKNCLDFVDDRYRTSFIAGLTVAKGQSPVRFEILFNGVDGHGVHTLVSPTPLYDDDDQYIGAFAVVTDISTLKQLQTQLLHAQKLESIGQLAAGIAHEINTPTQYVGNNVGFLADAFREIEELLAAHEGLLAASKNGEALAPAMRTVDETRERLQPASLFEEIPSSFHDIFQGLDRITKIVASMKAFAHPGQDQYTPANLNEAILSTITVSTNEWKYVADVETSLDPTLPAVVCNISAINQVILHLIVNAAHAIADSSGKGSAGKGTITIGTRNLLDYAEIRVGDTGCGIPEKIQNRVFDPFFTTKEVGKGTGQGLAIARTIITETHKGSITFETQDGKGTTFIILLPMEQSGAIF